MKTLIVILTLLLAPAAGASMLQTYSFTQAYPGTDSLSGTFTGSLEPNGAIELADLTAFTVSFTAGLGLPNSTETDTYGLADLQLFSIFPAADGPNSSLDFFASITTGTPGRLCVGAAAAFGLCGGNFGEQSNGVGLDNLRYAPNPLIFISTSQLAVVNLVPATQVAATPEPVCLGMSGMAILLLAIKQRRSRPLPLGRLP